VTTTIEEASWEGETMPTRAHDVGERRLVERLRAGQAAALEELYVAYRKPIFGFLVRLARDRPLAEDLFQNTWVKISKSAARLREDTQLKAWVFTVARNEFRSYQRWQMVDVTRLFLFHRDQGEPEREPNESMALAGVERGLAELGASDREVLLLVCAEGMDQEEAAKVLGISHAALRQRLGRARGRLKAVMSRLEGEREQ
jgi:RNA polymerase sigma-70 factor, ECF subfamily